MLSEPTTAPSAVLKPTAQLRSAVLKSNQLYLYSNVLDKHVAQKYQGSPVNPIKSIKLSHKFMKPRKMLHIFKAV